MSIEMIGIPSADLEQLPKVTRALAANAERNDRTADFPADGIRVVHQAGLLTATVARRYGGPGGGLADTARILGALGRGDPSVALISAMTLFTHAAQAAAPTWPGTVASRADGGENGGRISGRKIFSTGAEGLRFMAVWARTDDAEPQAGSFLVRNDAPGITIERSWEHLGLRASRSDDVTFDATPAVAALLDAPPDSCLMARKS